MSTVKRFYTLFAAMLFSAALFAQDAEKPEMADAFRQDGKIYVVVAVASLVFLGITTYLVLIDRKLRKLEKQQNAQK